MGQLAIAVVGGIVGSFFGMPQLGFMIGSLVGSMVAGGTHTEGPKLGDLNVTGASYGASIAFGIGTARLGGNIIWSPGLKEHSHKESQGKGGGSTTTTYTYTASFAAAFCEGPISAITRIWFDGKLVYDKTGTQAVTKVDGLNFRVYLGTEDQLPDPAIEADQGEGQVPAHRGLCYVVFQDCPLENFGNRVPTVTAEVTTNPERVFPVVRTSNADVMTPNGIRVSVGGIDTRRKEFYALRNDGIVVLDSVTMGVKRTVSFMDYGIAGLTAISFEQGSMISSPNSDYLQCFIDETPDSITNQTCTYIIHKDTLRLEARLLNSLKWSNQDVPCPGGWFKLRGSGKQYAMSLDWGGGVLGTPAFANIVTHDGSYTTTTPSFVSITDTGIDTGLCLPAVDWNQSRQRYLHALPNNDNVRLYLAQGEIVSSPTFALPDRVITENSGNWYVDLSDVAPSSNFWPSMALPFYDKSDDTFVILVSGGSRTVIVKWDFKNHQVLYKKILIESSLSGNYRTSDAGAHDCNGRLYVHENGANRYWEIDTGTGTLLNIFTVSGLNSTDAGYPLGTYVAEEEAVYTLSYGGNVPSTRGWAKFYVDRQQVDGEVPVAPFIERVAGRVGLSPSDLNLTEITQTVYGYYVSRTAAAKDVLSPLASACRFDAVESDYVIKFLNRNRPSSVAVTQDELQPDDDGEVLQEKTTQELELPSRVVVTYSDKDNAFQNGTQQAQRPSAPVKTINSNGPANVETPVIMDASRAKQLAETTLYTAWNERSGYTYQLDPKYLYLDPTDTLDMTLRDGTSYHQRLLKSTIGAELTLAVEAVGEDGATYSSQAEGDGGLQWYYPIPAIWPSLLVLLDVPYLRDEDTIGAEPAPIVYGSMNGYQQEGWRGAVGYREVAPGTYAAQFTETSQATIGSAVNALPAPVTPWATDETNYLDVVVPNAANTLSSITQEEMLNWGNAAALQSGTGWEIIQFRSVQQIAQDTYRLRGLLRGRRGTEQYVDGHTQGDAFVLLLASEQNIVVYDAASIGADVNWKAVSAGQYEEDVAPQTFNNKGNNLRPYAPVNLTAAEASPSGDIVISWVRRTRFNGELRDGTGDVPLNEEAEAYEVDIFYGDTLLRTLTSLTSPTATYTAAQRTEDGVPSGYRFVVYQLSAVVGRGFASKPLVFGNPAFVAQLSVTALMAPPSPPAQVAQLTTVVLADVPPPPAQVAQLSTTILTDTPQSRAQVAQLSVTALVAAA